MTFYEGHKYGQTHGMIRTPEYKAWCNMRNRCKNPNNPEYKNYGARNVGICPTWDDFRQFYADLGPRPSKDHSLDRIDNDAGYSKANCRWGTRKQQNRNKRSNVRVKINGVTKCKIEWMEQYGLHANLVRDRVKYGWPLEKALTTPVRPCKKQPKKL